MQKSMFKVSVSALLIAAMAGSSVAPALAQPRGGDTRDAYEDGFKAGYREGYNDGRYRRRYDDSADFSGYNARDYRDSGYNAPPPPPGPRADARDDRWRSRYQREYTYNDDSFYRECRQSSDPGGVIAGALIGGLLGNALGRGGGRTGATVAGVIVGGVAGATLTSHLECEDRSYAYKAYSDGFNSGRPDSTYSWRNPRNGHNGQFRVGDYYNDPDGFRCTTYTQAIYVDGQRQTASGRACQQPDGTWAVVS